MASYARQEVTKLLTDNRDAVSELRDLGWKDTDTDSFLNTYTVKIKGWCGGETNTLVINGDQLFRIADILAENG